MLADVFDALCSVRVYKKIVNYIKFYAGHKFILVLFQFVHRARGVLFSLYNVNLSVNFGKNTDKL